MLPRRLLSTKAAQTRNPLSFKERQGLGWGQPATITHPILIPALLLKGRERASEQDDAPPRARCNAGQRTARGARSTLGLRASVMTAGRPPPRPARAASADRWS